ncbi:MAG TPA: PhzF family phenazine biosynthesis protein [Rhizomicrobium sp.]|jgi:trans-2,3-dihydro-3-hydroxyanthranilate isomerase|nr:PhzF family phenazine biosynthesis protein [Rhizomicrobium sp.]
MKRRHFLAGGAGMAAAAALPAAAQTARGYDFVQVDVFTQNPLEGNPLACFPQANGLSDAQMQAIARELNHSETTFVLPPTAGGDARVRIFGPQNELPFAGHPSLGTAFVMAKTRPGKTALVLEENVGPIPITLERRPDGMFVEMTQNEPVFGAKADPKMLADALGFGVDEIDSRYAPQMVSTGSNFLILPLKSISTLAKLTLGHQLPPEQRAILRGGIYYVVTGEPQIESRLLGANSEDPATGSAVGCAAAFLIQNGIRKPDERIAVKQGRFVNRPSILYVRAGMANGKATNVRVGGYVVDVMRGRFTV